jgi:hypothetical protein
MLYIFPDAINAWVLFISTDYVFDGKNPPYKVTDEPNPLNLYGKGKVEGEKLTLKVNSGDIPNAYLKLNVNLGDIPNAYLKLNVNLGDIPNAYLTLKVNSWTILQMLTLH